MTIAERTPHSELRRAIVETRQRYGFPDIEKRYPAAMLDTFFLKDAIALDKQLGTLQELVAAMGEALDSRILEATHGATPEERALFARFDALFSEEDE